MADELKILLLEDDLVDAKLIEYELKKSDLTYSIKCADDREGFIDELNNFKPDIILSDFNLPHFHGFDALEIVKNQSPETPFILVTGNLDEETAVSCIKLGAWDYILKGKLARLIPAIKSSLKLKEEIDEKNRVIEDLKKSEAKYQDLYDNAPDMFLSFDPITGLILDCNQTFLRKMGYSRDEFVGQEIYKFYPQETSEFAKDVLMPMYNKTGILKGTELKVIKKDGSVIDVSISNSVFYDKDRQITYVRSIWRDVTERKITEQALRKSEEKYRTMLEAMQDIVIIKSPDNVIQYMNPAAKSKKSVFLKNYNEDLSDFNVLLKKDSSKVEDTIKLHHREIVDPSDKTIYLASYFPIKNIDGTDSVMCIYKDVTSLRNIESERISLLNILEATLNEIYIFDYNNHLFTYVNETAEKNSGYSKSQLLKMSPFDLLLNFNLQDLNQIIKSINVKANEKIVFEAKIKRADKSIYPVEIHMQLFEQHDSRMVLAVIIDITERQKKEELILKLSKGIEQSPASVLITDLNGNIEFINPKFIESSGYSFNEVKGKNPRILKSGYTAKDEYKKLWETILKGGIWHGEFLNKRKNGELIWEDAVIGPIKDKYNKITHFIGIKQDITERKKIEDELKEEKVLLSKRVDERTAELSRLNAELKKAVRMKDEFLANMSHELRTPLNSILGLSEVLHDELYGPLNHSQLKSLKTIEDSGRHLLALINDILDVAKIEAGKIELEISPVSIYGLCQASLNFIKQIALKKNINYNLKLETFSESINADERRLKQILINLLSNAVKFTPAGGEIGLSVLENTTDESISFTVWDKGIGIRPESLQKLFKPFVQIDSSLSREYAGTGLGLALVKSLTELHGGCITIDSVEGKGSSFIVTIPSRIYNKYNQNDITGYFQLFDQSKHRTPTGKVFIIEDASTEFEYLPVFSDMIGLEYFLNCDNSDLIENILQFKPDIILIDKEISDISSWEEFKKIKTHEIISNIPLIFLSNKKIDKEAQDIGIRDYIVKPLTNKKLAAILRKFIKGTHGNYTENKTTLILIAEDNENNILMMSDYFKQLNYKILTARNGMEAIKIAEEKFPDIILMDIQMPEMDGIEATRLIRKHKDKKVSHIPIIAITALAMPDDERKCIDAGMNGYIKKPVSLKKLIREIEEKLLINN